MYFKSYNIASAVFIIIKSHIGGLGHILPLIKALVTPLLELAF